MSKTYIPVAVRRLVIQRANSICEYCLIPAAIRSEKSYHVDHVISEKHGGETKSMNLALACPDCNIRKGSDIASCLPGEESVFALYNPRLDDWYSHFEIKPDGELRGKTPNGIVTINLLELNEYDRAEVRKIMLLIGEEIVPKPRLL